MSTDSGSERPTIDLVVRGTIVTVDPDRRVLTDGAVAIAGDRIVAVGHWSDIDANYKARQVVGSSDSVVTPGMINTHQHLTGDRLMRSAIPDNLPPGAAIYDWVVPGHAEHTPEDDLISALLGLAEALGNGITTTVEAGTVAHPERVADAYEQVGARGTLGCWGWDMEDQPFAGPPAEVLDRQRANIAALAPRPLVDGWVTLVGHDLMSDELASGAAALARELDTHLTFHLSPSDGDAVAYLERTGKRPALHLADLGVLGPHLLLAHAVHLDDAEIEQLVATDTAVAYCPWAYLRLGQGLVHNGRHMDMIQRGVRVGLGCDAENAGDAVDMLRTVALTAGLAKDMTGDPVTFGAHEALEMATIGAAAAIGRAHDLGSVEVGKQADLVVHDTAGVQWIPRSPDPVLQLVWASDGRSVSDVIVAGQRVVTDGTVAGVDLGELHTEAARRAHSLYERSGVTAAPRWPATAPRQ